MKTKNGFFGKCEFLALDHIITAKSIDEKRAPVVNPCAVMATAQATALFTASENSFRAVICIASAATALIQLLLLIRCLLCAGKLNPLRMLI